MCGRFAAGHLTQKQMQEIVEGFLDGSVEVDGNAPDPVQGYHIRPTNRIGLVVQDGPGALITLGQLADRPAGRAAPDQRADRKYRVLA